MAIPLREPGSDDGQESRFPFSTTPLGEFLEKQIAPLAWLVPGLVPAKGVTLIVSAPNAGKTFLALDYACQCAAAGRKVLIVEEEGSERGFQERLRRAAEAHGLSGDKLGLIEVTWNSNINLMDGMHQRYLIELCKVKGIEVVILDSLAALSRGIDENDSGDMSMLAEALHQLYAETGAAVIGLHHVTKEGARVGGTPTLAMTRGHGTLIGRIDAALALVGLESPAGVVRFELYCVKQREGEKPPPRTVEVTMTGPAATMRFIQLEQRQGMSEGARRVSDMMHEVLRAIPEGDLNAISCNGVVSILRKHKQTVNAAIKELLFAGKLGQLGDGKVYRIKAPVQKPSDSGRYAGTGRYRGGLYHHPDGEND